MEMGETRDAVVAFEGLSELMFLKSTPGRKGNLMILSPPSWASTGD